MAKIIGHRGAKGLAPENTLESIEKALAVGVDMIEIDVHVSRDNVVLLSHDPLVSDKNGQEHPIASRAYQQLLTNKPDMPTLEQAIRLVNHRVPLVIEVKPTEPVTPVIAVVKALLAEGWRHEELLLGSKSQKTLRALHQALPELQKVVIERLFSIRATFRARQVDTKILFMSQHYLWWGVIRSLAKRGYEQYPYTVNDPRKAARWLRYGLSGVITDYPDRFKT